MKLQKQTTQQNVAPNKKEENVMTNKNLMEIMNANGVKVNEETKHFEMTQNKFSKMYELPELENVNIVKSKKNENLWAVRENGKTIGVIEIVKKATKTKKENVSHETSEEPAKPEKTKKENVETGGHGHKVKGAGYIIIFKNKEDKKETTKTDLTSCAEIKEWLKTISKKQLEYLRIYDENKKECRKSAWIEREA